MKRPQKTQKINQLTVQNRQQWRDWLSQNHASAQGVWLVIKKKGNNEFGVALDDAVEEAVAYGWIDSKLHVIDKKTYQLLFTPRKAGSLWSESNKVRVEKLFKEGLMTPTGREKVEVAKRDGSWNKLDAVNELRLPPDFETVLAADSEAQNNFAAFAPSTKKQILWWIEIAKRPQTRQKRILQTVAWAKQNKNPLAS
jgi:uncharacterized protein YdeI (YjbR/CyaY-like superfamily)